MIAGYGESPRNVRKTRIDSAEEIAAEFEALLSLSSSSCFTDLPVRVLLNPSGVRPSPTDG